MSKRKWTTGIYGIDKALNLRNKKGDRITATEYIRAYLLKLAKKGIEEKNAIKNGGDEPT